MEGVSCTSETRLVDSGLGESTSGISCLRAKAAVVSLSHVSLAVGMSSTGVVHQVASPFFGM